jgi:hypothetical protein
VYEEEVGEDFAKRRRSGGHGSDGTG